MCVFLFFFFGLVGGVLPFAKQQQHYNNKFWLPGSLFPAGQVWMETTNSFYCPRLHLTEFLGSPTRTTMADNELPLEEKEPKDRVKVRLQLGK